MKGFFSTSQVIKQAPTGTIAKCGKCGLYKQEDVYSARMKPTGDGKLKILVMGEAPGEIEDRDNTQWVGAAGQKLRDILNKFDIDLDRDCWKTNAIICRPTKKEDERVLNREPLDNEIVCCRPNLLQTIKELKPVVIIALGATALKSLIPLVWNESSGKTRRWGGRLIPCQKFNCWIGATIHPSAILRSEWNPVMEVIFEKEITSILKKRTRPWKKVPDFRKKVEILYSSVSIRDAIHEVVRRGTPTAWDLETNCLKPETKNSEIVSCSMSQIDGRTFAFPWSGDKVKQSMSRFLIRSVPKIASNMKFEDRWVWNKLGVRVKGWWWDTMIASHILNGCSGGTGLKFLSFCYFGLPVYNKHIDSLLESTDKNGLNRIHEIEMNDLLIYNGLDSFLEKRIAIRQRIEMGY